MPYTYLLGKKHTLIQYWPDCYGVTKSFLIGFEDSTEEAIHPWSCEPSKTLAGKLIGSKV